MLGGLRLPRRLRVSAVLAVLVALAVGSFQPFYVRMLAADRSAMRAWLIDLPYSKVPTLRAFLLEARENLEAGQTVVFLAPFTRFEQGYRYAFGRANYVLARNRVLPLVDAEDRMVQASLREADVAVSWRTSPPPGFEIVWTHPEGSISRRTQ